MTTASGRPTLLATSPIARARHAVGGLDRRLTAPGGRARFEMVRAALAVVLAARLGLRHWSEAADIPEELFRASFVVAWLDAPPPGWLLSTVALLGVAAAGLAILKVRPRAGFGTAWLALLFLGGIWGSAGKVMHNDVLLLLTAVPFVVASGRPATGERRDRSVAFGWPPRVALLIIAAVYFLAGVQKLNHSGLEWVTSENMRWVLLQGAESSRSPWPGLARTMAGNALVASLIAAGSLVLELAAPVLLAVRRTRLAFAAGAACLHGVIWLTLGLDYYGWILTVAAVAIPMGSAPAPDTAVDAQADHAAVDSPPPG